MPNNRRLIVVIFLWVSLTLPLFGAELSVAKPNAPKLAPASEEAELAMLRFRVKPGFEVELFAAEPMFAHPVAFAIDEKNRVYVSESFRVGTQVTDIRGHMNWLDEELASTNTSQFLQLIERKLDPKFMRAETERISLLEDMDGDGKADRSRVFADGFNQPASGIASGVLARKGDVWFTCIPDLWRLRDSDGDGKADARESLQHGYGVRFGFYGHDLHGLRIGPDGKLYFTIGDRGMNVVTREGTRVASPETGAVLRCNLDGSGLEIFAIGLRNPQELAFDQFGNLFTGDNNSDGGDQARWVHLVEGGDSGWRIGWQFLTAPVSRGPWNAERMWSPANPDQPAYIVPPLANFSNGPSGLSFYPGTGLPPEYANHFFLCDFKGTPASSLVHSFALKPKGATFEVVDLQPFISMILATDVEFGMDGAVYVSDWVQGWGKTGKGRIYRIYRRGSQSDPVVKETRAIMAAGFESRSDQELVSLLSWPDQRVRQEAQFELASRGPSSIAPLSEAARAEADVMGRLHAVWGLAQIARGNDWLGRGRSASAVSAEERFRANEALVGLLESKDAEIQTQAAKALGDAHYKPAREALEKFIIAGNERQQLFATMALGKLSMKESGPALLQFLRAQSGKDPYLRHAGVMALHWLNDPALLKAAAQDSSAEVRMAALLAFRRSADPAVSQFLTDPDARLVLEAARAIYDLPIASEMAKLGKLIERAPASEPLIRRIIHALHRMGTPSAAEALGRFASGQRNAQSARLEALELLADWENPPGRDRITGLWRPMAKRDGNDAAKAVALVLNDLMTDRSEQVQAAGAKLAGKYQIKQAAGTLMALALSEETAAQVRIQALRSLESFKHPSLQEALDSANASRNEAVRNEASALLAKMNPSAGVERLAMRLETGSTTGEKQAAFAVLGNTTNQASSSILNRWLDRLLAGTVPPPLQLDLIEAAQKMDNSQLQAKIAQFDSRRPTNEIGRFIESLGGGNAAEGRRIFFEKPEASCARCHKIGAEGGEAGPPLNQTLRGRTREYILESIVAPSKSIAPGYENVIVTLMNGDSHAGTVKGETENELVLYSFEELGAVTLSKKDIKMRRNGGSGMPESVPELLSKREIRDLVEFLATLN